MSKCVYYRCSCYFTDNFFVPKLKRHLQFFGNDARFSTEHSQLVSSHGLAMDDVLHQIKKELKRRNDVAQDSTKRRSLIFDGYKTLDAPLFTLTNDFFDERFLALCEKTNEESLSSLQVYKLAGQQDVYRIPMFSPSFCDRLLAEIENYRQSGFPLLKPNTMNNYGVLLDEIGFESLFDNVRGKVNTLAQTAFPEWTLDGLDSHRAFTVAYSPTTDADLALHFDNAEVTINVGLTEPANYSGGDIEFFDVADGENSAITLNNKIPPVSHQKGWALLHRSRQFHRARCVTEGLRENLIIWMRSSSVRNQKCPMCWRRPDLIAVGDGGGYGDGFTCDNQIQMCSLV